MKVTPPTSIELTANEQKLRSQINFEPHDDAVDRSCKAAKQLATLLRDRNAIPKVRLRYFTDPALNIRTTKSRQELFVSNGTAGDEILEHPHFLRYLRYFIHGPQLPKPTIKGFCDIVQKKAGTSGEVLDQMCEFGRTETRRRKLDKYKACDEFHKLALECGLSDSLARTIRDSVRQTR